MLRRRGFLVGIASALAAPAIIRMPGLLMPVKPLDERFRFSGFYSRFPLAQLPNNETIRLLYADMYREIHCSRLFLKTR